MNIDWSKAPRHATHWCPGNARIESGWIYAPGGNCGEFYSCYADSGLEHIPAFPDWRKNRLIQRPKINEWTGEGMPPVGTVCTMIGCVDDPDTADFEKYKSHVGAEVSIIAHREVGTGVVAAVYEISVGGGMFEYYAMCADCFEPRKTQEQIAAEERMSTAYGMCAIVKTLANVDAAALYDAGYRRQVTD